MRVVPATSTHPINPPDTARRKPNALPNPATRRLPACVSGHGPRDETTETRRSSGPICPSAPSAASPTVFPRGHPTSHPLLVHFISSTSSPVLSSYHAVRIEPPPKSECPPNKFQCSPSPYASPRMTWPHAPFLGSPLLFISALVLGIIQHSLGLTCLFMPETPALKLKVPFVDKHFTLGGHNLRHSNKCWCGHREAAALTDAEENGSRSSCSRKHSGRSSRG